MKKVPHYGKFFLIHSLQNIKSDSHWFWTHVLIVPYVASCLSVRPQQHSKVDSLTTLYYFSAIKNGFLYLFFLSSGTYQSWHFTGINSLLISFLNVLRCLNLLHHTISLTKKIVSGLSLPKLILPRLSHY